MVSAWKAALAATGIDQLRTFRWFRNGHRDPGWPSMTAWYRATHLL